MLHIFDPALLSVAEGHHYNYDAGLAEGFRGAGIDFRLYGHRRIDPKVAAALGAIPFFSHSLYHPFVTWKRGGKLLSSFPLNWTLFRDLRAGTGALGIEPGDTLFFPTATTGQFLAICLYHRLLSRRVRCNLFLILHFDDYRFRPVAGQILAPLLYLPAFPLLKANRERVFLGTHSESLRKGWSGRLGMPVHLLPLPYRPEIGPTAARDGVTVGFFGVSSADKGYHLLPEIVRRVRAAAPEVRFLIQTRVVAPSPEVVAAAAELEGMGPEVEILAGNLPREEYEAALRRADLFLCPYRPEAYGGRISAVFSDALSLGKAVLVSRGTSLEEQLAEVPVPHRLIRERGAEAFAAGILDYLANRKAVDRAYAEAGTEWRRRGGPERFVSRVLEMGLLDHEGPQSSQSS